MAERRQTALGVARARFVEGLPRKAREVRASLALLAGTPEEERPREELRRRLHALYASAQVFRIEPLAAALKEALAQIDAVRDERRGFSQDELDALATLAATLPALGRTDDDAMPSVDTAIPTPVATPAPTPAPAPSATPAPRAPPPAPPSRPQPSSQQASSPRPRRRGVETVVSVLVVDDPAQHAHVRAALPPERFEVLTATTGAEALRIARSAAPDVVLADRSIALSPEVDLIGRLREDPLTDFVPVVLLVPAGAPLDRIAVRSAGAEDALSKPLDAQLLLRTVEHAVQLGGPAGASTLTGDLTVEQLAERLADEVKRGIVEAAEKGRDVAVPVGDGTPLLAAAWSAIGKVRAHIAERSGGRVRFREGPARGGPAFVSVAGEDAQADELPEGFTLAGRRILVADDDPAVVWFFAGLLREHGADVVETSDGVAALEAARKRRPDIIVSDILMPGLDGFGLTRALKRDPILADVPVILLSWKEDLLQRMRELRAGASGYLRKEAAAGQILAAVRDVLRPRALLESRLKAGGDVRGRLEDVGVQALILTVAAMRPDARLTVRDASSLYEIDVRGGEVVDVTRTASDGAFARGPRVFEALLGSVTGRYTVADADGPVRQSIEVGLAALIDGGMRALAARVDAVSGKNLAKAAEVELDEGRLEPLLRSSPEEVERIAAELRGGKGPRELLLGGAFEPQVLEEVLADLARQGAIVGVRGERGEDRIALAREARERGLHPELSEHEETGTLSWLPPRQRAMSEAPLALDDADLESLRPPPVPEELRPRPLAELEPPPERAQRTSDIPTLDEPFGEELDDDDDEPALSAEPWEGATGELAAIARAEQDEAAAPDLASELGDDEGDEDTDDDGAEDEETGDEEAGEEEAGDEETGDEETGDEEAGDAEAGDEVEDEEGDGAPAAGDPELEASSDPPDPPAALRIPPGPKLIEDEVRAAPLRPAPPPPARAAGGMGMLAWTLVLLVAGAIGFVGWRLATAPDEVEAIGPVPPDPRAARPPDPRPADPDEPSTDEPDEPDETAQTDPAEPPADAPPAYGREEPRIADVGVTPGAGQGLLVLEPTPGGAAMRVRVGDREIAVEGEPVGLAVDPGVHHLAYSRGDHQDFVWVAVRSGRTRFVPPLP